MTGTPGVCLQLGLASCLTVVFCFQPGSRLHFRTLLLEPDDLRVGAEAVPGGAVVDGLEVGPHDVADGQRGDDALLCADRLHRVAARCARFQHILLPGPGDAVGRWRAPDEALDLALFPMQGMLGLGAGDDGGSIDSQGHLSLPSPNAGHHGSAHVFPRVLLANGFEGQRLLIAQDHARAPLHPDDGQGRVACPGAAEDGVRAQVYEQRLGLCGHPVSCLENPMDRGAWRAKSRT